MTRLLALAAAVLLTPTVAVCNDGQHLKAPSSDASMSTVRYQCQQDKTIVADFFAGNPSVCGATIKERHSVNQGETAPGWADEGRA